MRSTPHSRTFLPATLMLAAASSVIAQPATEPQAPDLLRGPAMKTTEPSGPARTLVRRDFEGKLERLETRPEAAAIGVMEFDAATRAALDELTTRRAAEINAALRANMPLFLEIQAANQSGDRAGAAPLIRKLVAAAPGIFSPPLANRYAALMSAQDAATFRAMVDEYNQAVFLEQALEAPGASRPAAGRELNPRRVESMQTIREMARALNATVTERRERLDAALKAIDASPELGDQIRSIVRASAEKSAGGELTQEQRRDSTRQILELLTPEQRRTWLAHLRGG